MHRLRLAAGFYATTVVTMGFAIGALIAVFTLCRAVMDPVTIAESDRVVAFASSGKPNALVATTVAWTRYQFLRSAARSFAAMGAYTLDSTSLLEDDRPAELLRAARVSGAFFEVTRIAVVRGRTFSDIEDQPNGPNVCLLSYETWRARFGGADVLGRSIVLDGHSTQIVGVLPPRLSPPWADRELFLPRVFEDTGVPPASIPNGASFLEVVARLSPGVTVASAAEEVRVLSHTYSKDRADMGDAAADTYIQSLTDSIVDGRRPVFIALLVAVLGTLLLTCINVAALFIGRLVSRQREFAVRQVLGASRRQLIRQINGEGAAIAAAGGVFGVIVAQGLIAACQQAFSGVLPAGTVLHLDFRAGVVAVIAAAASGLAAGALPALHFTSGATSVLGFDRGASESLSTRRVRGGLVVVETALSVVLLVGASLLFISLRQLERVPIGFRAEGVAAAMANLSRDRYEKPERQSAFFLDVVDAIKRSPSVEGAAVVSGLPFNEDNYLHAYAPRELPLPPPAQRRRAGFRIVSEDYFPLMGMRLVTGRGFTAADAAGAPQVCVLNETLARKLFPNESPLGHVILRGRDADQAYEIVGVVADVRTNGPRRPSPDEIFYSFRQIPRASAFFVARTKGDPGSLLRIFQAAAASVDRTQPLSRFATMTSRMNSSIGVDRLLAGVTSAFAALGVSLAAFGLYAVVAHGVATRQREIGVRMALGSSRRTIVGLVVRTTMRTVVAGTVLGLLLALPAARAVGTQLVGVSAFDAGVYGAVAVFFIAIGVLAAALPARRASSVNPLVALQP